MCEFMSQSYTTLFLTKFISTVFGELEKGYLELHWSLWWQRKYPQKKTRKELFEKLLWDMWIHLREVQCCFCWIVCEHSFLGICNQIRYFGAHCGLWWQMKYPHIKTTKKLSQKLLGDVLIHLTELHDIYHGSIW